MAWRRHNRHLTHEVFYDGTTIDGSRLEKGMRDMEDGFNDVQLGDIANRFVAVQYHGGFSPQPYAPPQVANVEVTAVGNDGDTHAVIIDGTSGSYIKQAGDGLDDVVDGLILALTAAVTGFTYTDNGADFDVAADVATQAFVITYWSNGTATGVVTLPAWSNRHHFPWLEIRNQGTSVDIVGEIPPLAPYSQLRFKGTSVPGITLNSGLAEARDGTQWAWTRTFSFKRPVILHAMSVFMHVDGGADADRPYKGESAVAGADAYEFGTYPAGGFTAGDYTSDVTVLADVFNQSTPEDVTMTDVPYIRRRWVVNREVFTTFVRNATATDWDDMEPIFSSVDVADARPINGRLIEDRDLNIPLPAGSKVRMAVIIPQYNNVSVTSSWGAVPWFVQAWSATMTVLEEIQAR